MFTLTKDTEDDEVVTRFATRDEAARAWRATEGDRSLLSATVRDDDGKRVLHWEHEAEEE